MADSFSILCEYIQLNKPVAILTGEGKALSENELVSQDELPGYVSFGPSLCYPLNTPSPIKSSRGGISEPHYTLFCIYYAYLRRNASFMEYLQETRNKGWPSVSLVDRKDILALLSGTLKSSNLIDTENREDWTKARPVSIDTIARGKRAAESVEAGDSESEETHGAKTRKLFAEDASVLSSEPTLLLETLKSREKNLRPNNAIFLSKNKTYGQAIALMKSLLRATEPSRSAGTLLNAPKKSNLVPNPRATAVKDEYSVQTVASLLPSSVQKPHHHAAIMETSTSTPIVHSGGSLYRQYPIIIVPAAPSSLLTLYNVKDFLEHEKFVAPDEARLKAQNRKEPIVLVHRKSKGNNSSLMTCQVIDSTQKLKSEDWARVIAVFAQGAAWQFKGWKYDKPVELFSHVKGFHLKYEDDIVSNPTIKSWNVTTLTVHKTKRYLDIEAVVNFWSKLDSWLLSHPYFDYHHQESPRKEKSTTAPTTTTTGMKKPAHIGRPRM